MMRVGTAKLAKVNSKKVSRDRVKVPKYSKICARQRRRGIRCIICAKIWGHSLIYLRIIMFYHDLLENLGLYHMWWLVRSNIRRICSMHCEWLVIIITEQNGDAGLTRFTKHEYTTNEWEVPSQQLKVCSKLREWNCWLIMDMVWWLGEILRP